MIIAYVRSIRAHVRESFGMIPSSTSRTYHICVRNLLGVQAFNRMPACTNGHGSFFLLLPFYLQLEEWDKRTGVLTTAKATTAATYSRMAEVVAKATENEKVQGVMSNVHQGVSTGW